MKWFGGASKMAMVLSVYSFPHALFVCANETEDAKTWVEDGVYARIKCSRRPSLTSVQSSSSSIRSYSARRWEREREQKERRQMSMRLAQLHDKMAAGREVPKHAPTPSPRSPNNSTDGLLPSVCEIRELINNPEREQQLQGVDGPCSSSSLY